MLKICSSRHRWEETGLVIFFVSSANEDNNSLSSPLVCLDETSRGWGLTSDTDTMGW